jgi:GDP/UDP-N,N'-diacetylbacillosamine 2-epimerase (hydrolysing)
VRKICVFTGTRAEYGLLRPLMQEIKNDKSFNLQIIASAMHLSAEYGCTYKEIEKDKFAIDAKVRIPLNTNTPMGLAKAVGAGLINLSKAILRLNPDIIVVLGDRFEAFALATAAMISKTPLAHISGGEATFGLLDEAIRHSITKMSYLHFVSTEKYRQRVIQLGESPGRVFNVGALGVDNIRRLKFLSKKELEKELNFKFNKKNLLVTFHPVTLENNTAQQQFQNLLDVLDELENTNIIFTKANADPGGKVINRMIDEYVQRNIGKAKAFTSLGYLRYLSAMRLVDAVVGNSSSGIIETPSFKIGTINIGDRQEGRIRLRSIIDCKPTKEDIRRAFKILYSKKFRQSLRNVKSPYGDGKAAKRIVKILKRYDTKSSLKKHFYDINS